MAPNSSEATHAGSSILLVSHPETDEYAGALDAKLETHSSGFADNTIYAIHVECKYTLG